MRYIFVVHRDHPDLFTYMRDHFAEVPEIVVMVDRRCGDRRRQESGGPTDRRRGERRAAPARTWTTLGFLTAPVLDQVTCDHVPA